MPAYEYRCNSCGHTFEKSQGMREKALEKCPECDGKIQRLIGGGAGIIVKRSVFYASDNAKSSAPACGRDRPCCGRDVPCEDKSCE